MASAGMPPQHHGEPESPPTTSVGLFLDESISTIGDGNLEDAVFIKAGTTETGDIIPVTGKRSHQQSLEDRVHELETKLAVVSRLLQAHRLRPKHVSPVTSDAVDEPTVTQDESEEPKESVLTTPNSSKHTIMREISDTTPHLESPAVPRQTKSPSYLEAKALYSSDEEGSKGASSDDGGISAGLLPKKKEVNNGTTPLELLMQPPSESSLPLPPPSMSSRASKPRGISMDETVVQDNRRRKRSVVKEEGATMSSAEDASISPAGKATSQMVRPQPTKRNLSFRLLYNGEEDAYNNPHDVSTSSLTLAERLWLGPSLLQFQRQEQSKADREELRKDKRKRRPTYRRLSYPRLPPLQVPDDSVRSKWLDHLNSFQDSTADVDVQMEEFIKVPGQLESLMSFGFCICIDSFLYMITILPIRFVWSFILLLLLGVDALRRHTRPLNDTYRLHRHHLYPVYQVFILYTIHRYVLVENSIGMLYHWIRGQAMLKLYVLLAMVEVSDRLFGNLGQDCLESMYWNTINRPRSHRMLISVLVVLLYASVHSLLLFLHVVTLHVAMNSTDQVLITLLIGGCFAEVKSTVFKKYNKAALFKITSSDICERFKIALFLSLVLMLNACQGLEPGQLMGHVRLWGMVVGSELLSDWIKHSFITKFNFLPSKVYAEYALLLAGDVTGIGHEGVNLDNSHAVVKRIGFAQIPLVSILFRLTSEAYKYFAADNVFPQRWSGIALISIWLILLIIKMALGNFLQRSSVAKLLAAPEFSKSPKMKQKAK